MTTEKEAVELFGQFLMKHLRDRAIGFSEKLAQGRAGGGGLSSQK